MIDSYEKYRQVAKYAGGYFEEQFLELINRLEAAEGEVESIRQGISFRDDVVAALTVERDALRAELSKQQALTDAAQHIAEVAQSRANQLQAKITEMERQEPVMWANSSNINSSRINRERGGCGDQHTCSETQTTYHDTQLYALPGAQGEKK